MNHRVWTSAWPLAASLCWVWAMMKVQVAIGYAPLVGESISDARRSGGTLERSLAAAEVDSTFGVMNSPALFWPMAAATPSLPLPPMPVAQLTSLPAPTLDLNWGFAPARNWVRLAVVPEESDRWTTVTFVEGRFTPGFSLVRAGSFQLLILPRNRSPAVLPSSLSGWSTPSRL